MADEYLNMTPAEWAAITAEQRKAFTAAYHRDQELQKRAQQVQANTDKAQKAEAEFLAKSVKEQGELLWRNGASVAGKNLAKPNDGASDNINRVLNYQLESIAMGAIFNMLIYGMRIGLGIQYTADLIEYRSFSKTYIAYDEKLHKAFVALPVGATALSESADNKYVPVNYNPQYHKLFIKGPANAAPKEWNDANTPSLDLIRQNGYLPEPTVLDSVNKDINILHSKLRNVSDATRQSMMAGLTGKANNNNMEDYVIANRQNKKF